MSDVYQTPQADFNEPSNQSDQYGSIEQALAGNYSINVGDILSEAWNLTKGAKLKFHLAFLIYFIAYLVVMFVVSFVLGLVGITTPTAGDPSFDVIGMILLQTVLSTVLITFATAPLWTGVMYMGVQRSVGEQLKASTILNYFYAIVPLGIAYLIMYLLTTIGFLLLIIPGIYLAISYSMALLLILDKGMSPWQALETSRKAVTKHWFSLFGLFLVMMLVNILGAIPLGLGWIWTFPLSIIAYGAAYRNMFGYSAKQNN